MYRLVTNQEINLAETTMRSLRSAINNPNRGVGPQAREQLRVLSVQMNAASVAIDTLRADIHNPVAKYLVQEYDRIERTAREIVDNLDVAARYDGPRRGGMNLRQKTAYVTEHGEEKFNNLPY